LSSAAACTWYINTHNEILLLPSDENENPRAPNACTRRTIKFYSCRPAVAAAVVRILWREREALPLSCAPDKIGNLYCSVRARCSIVLLLFIRLHGGEEQNSHCWAEYSRACVIALLLRIHLHLRMPPAQMPCSLMRFLVWDLDSLKGMCFRVEACQSFPYQPCASLAIRKIEIQSYVAWK
jgi:hypothetical protein